MAESEMLVFVGGTYLGCTALNSANALKDAAMCESGGGFFFNIHVASQMEPEARIVAMQRKYEPAIVRAVCAFLDG